MTVGSPTPGTIPTSSEGTTPSETVGPSSPTTRRAYTPPCLESLGRLAEMTRFGGSDIVDSGGGLGQNL